MVSRDFSREKRLLTSRQFQNVFDSPTIKVPGNSVLLLVRQNGLSHARLGLVIGKKSVKLSVERNRLKRVLRDSFRHHQHMLEGLDIVVIARKGFGDIENSDLHQHLGKLWNRLARKQLQKTDPSEHSKQANGSYA
ncbi:ribonuclease P protein component [Pseudomonas luteola]|uniref:ribonuclease P protein component n=1 Tax=Pseudomonas luteola TaxID=47886 RepID=UPI001EF59A01|nr:ribonuclease P protein component [Pseudomonas luteola]